MENTFEKELEVNLNQIKIISRNDIPAIHEVNQEGKIHKIGELRDFQWHETLKQSMPPATEFSMGWVQLQENETLAAHAHPMQSMMIFYEGSGQLIGQRHVELKAGDVVVVPPGCEHGFVGGPGGLHAFSIQFGAGIYTDPQNSQVIFQNDEFNLEKLLAHNQQRLKQFSQQRFFELIQDGTLENPKKRQAFLDYLQIWVDGNQTLLFTRQATAINSPFEKTFLQHMYEEMGHERLYDARNQATKQQNKPIARDAIMEAITNWVSYQMLVLDNVEKAAIVHLVIENASNYYHSVAQPQLVKYISDEYFNVHIENDSEHAAMGERLLQNQTPHTYLRLKEIVDEAWDMLEAMTSRVAYLTDNA